MKPRTFFLFVSPVLVVAGLLFWRYYDARLAAPALYWDDGVRRALQDTVDERYLEPLDADRERELFEAAMKAYVAQLDEYSRYFTPAEKRDLDEDTTGSFAGIGVQVRSAAAGGMLVTAVYREGPADEAGVEPGDLIQRVDETALVGRTLEQMVQLVKGPVASPVSLWIRRGDEPVAEFVVKRGLVALDTVPAVRLFEGDVPVGYVRISQFSESTGEEVRKQLGRLVDEQGARALVLDLRRNLGGVVSAAVDVAALFLPPDAVVCVTRSRERVYRYSVPSGVRHDVSTPLVVLVDEGSASASEIMAGALQDHGRAILLGTRTYGKFLVQTLVPLQESDGLVRLTTARYETPYGRSGQRDGLRGVRGGLMPEVRLPLGSAEEVAALRTAFLEQAGPRWRIIDGRGSGAQHVDRQLQMAISLLRGADPPAEPIPPTAPEQG